MENPSRPLASGAGWGLKEAEMRRQTHNPQHYQDNIHATVSVFADAIVILIVHIQPGEWKCSFHWVTAEVKMRSVGEGRDCDACRARCSNNSSRSSDTKNKFL